MQYVKWFKNKIIYIIPDNDQAGQKYAENIYRETYKVAEKVQILNLTDELPDLEEKRDISDVLERHGKEKTLEIIERLKEKNLKSSSFPIQGTDELNEECSEIIPFDIKTLSKEEIADKNIFNYLLTIEDEFERQKIIAEIEERAKEINCSYIFKNLLKIYKQKIKQFNKAEPLQHNEVAEMLLKENSFAIYENNLYIYVNGVYIMDKKSIERKIISLAPNASSHFRDEIYKYLELKDNINMTLDKESEIINFKNGLYNIKDKKLYEHTSDFFSINQIKTKFNEKAKAVKEVDDFLNKISTYNQKRKQTILEMIGYCMTTSIKFQKAFILYGETARNGKSTLITVITKLIGIENIGNVSFQDMNNNRFAGFGIKGKILNVGSEMTEEYLKDVSIFKMWISGDNLEVERKFKDRQTIYPYAKFIFNANTLPRVADKTNAFYRRLHIIPFETVFTDEDSKQFDINKILTDEALEYLARISLEAYISMNGIFSNYEESNKEVIKYKVGSNSVLSFVNDKEYIEALYKNEKISPATNVYKCYKTYCSENKLNPIGRNKFYEEIEKSKLITVKSINHQKNYIFNI